MPSRDEVVETARLAGLALTRDEVERMQRELDGILKHIEALRQAAAPAAADVEGSVDERSAVDTAAAVAHVDTSEEDRPPTSDQLAPLRADLPRPDPLDMPPSYFAPEWRDGFFTLPRLRTHD